MKKQLSLLFCTLCTALFLNAQDQTINGATFKQDGKVGIGTTAPDRTLEVSENSGTDAVVLRLSNTGWISNMSTSLEFKTGGSKTVPTSKISSIMNGSGNAGDRLGFFLQENGANPNNNPLVEKFSILPDGDVGIGTKTPYSKLQVEGRTSVGKLGVLNIDWTNEANWGGSSYKWAGYIGFNAYRNDDDAKDNYYGRHAYTNKGVFEGSNYGFRWLYRNRINSNDSNAQHQLTEYMRLDNNGNLGIGTYNTQGFKLGVNGDIAALEVKIATYANWPDYVFKEAYNLPTLEDVEQQIKDNGHLKDIPSAEKVKEEGFYLGDMDAKLLQKIEELTLYTIEQQKEIEVLKKENEELKSLSKRLAAIEALLNTQKQ